MQRAKAAFAGRAVGKKGERVLQRGENFFHARFADGFAPLSHREDEQTDQQRCDQECLLASLAASGGYAMKPGWAVSAPDQGGGAQQIDSENVPPPS